VILTIGKYLFKTICKLETKVGVEATPPPHLTPEISWKLKSKMTKGTERGNSNDGIISDSNSSFADFYNISILTYCLFASILVCMFACIEPVYHKNLLFSGHSSIFVTTQLSTIN
jgi:hypothetical protein